MADLSFVAVAIAWITLLIVAPVIVLVHARGGRGGWRRPAGAAMLIGIVGLAMAAGVETVWRPVNWLVLAAAYVAWAMLVGLAFTLSPRALGIVLGASGVLTLVPGVLLCTVGVLALFFIAGDYGRPPTRVVRLAPGLDCVETSWGMAASDDGRDIHLYRTPSWLPLLRRQVKRVTMDETHPAPGVPASTACPAQGSMR